MGDNVKLASILRNYLCLGQQVEKAECIIGLGSYDLRVADRCVELFNQGMGEFIVFSGAEGNWTRGLWNKPEAEVFKARALAQGIENGKLFVEDQSTNIGANIRFSRSVIEKKLSIVNKVIFVTKPQTERRVYATVPIEWPEITFSVTSPSIKFENQPLANHSMEDLINEMVGDLQRIIVYAKKGMQLPQPVPQEVLDAYHYLRMSGFDKHLIKNSD